MRRFRRPFARRPRRPTKWAASQDIITNQAGGTLVELVLLTEGDYSENTNLSPSGVTMVRMVGGLHLHRNTVAASTTFSVRAAIIAGDSDENGAFGGNFDPDVVATLIDERVLWIDEKEDQLVLAAPTNAWVDGWNVKFDIRQKVKLHNTTVSMFLNIRTGSTSVSGNVWTRSLVMGAMT